jgi:hypothetical protein
MIDVVVDASRALLLAPLPPPDAADGAGRTATAAVAFASRAPRARLPRRLAHTKPDFEPLFLNSN